MARLVISPKDGVSLSIVGNEAHVVIPDAATVNWAATQSGQSTTAHKMQQIYFDDSAGGNTLASDVAADDPVYAVNADGQKLGNGTQLPSIDFASVQKENSGWFIEAQNKDHPYWNVIVTAPVVIPPTQPPANVPGPVVPPTTPTPEGELRMTLNAGTQQIRPDTLAAGGWQNKTLTATWTVPQGYNANGKDGEMSCAGMGDNPRFDITAAVNGKAYYRDDQHSTINHKIDAKSLKPGDVLTWVGTVNPPSEAYLDFQPPGWK